MCVCVCSRHVCLYITKYVYTYDCTSVYIYLLYIAQYGVYATANASNIDILNLDLLFKSLRPNVEL